MKELNLTQGSVPKVLLQFAVPFLIANVLQALYGGADLFVVGQYDDSASVAAVAIGSQVMQTITGIILGITTGTTVLIAIATGAKDNRKVASTIGILPVLIHHGWHLPDRRMDTDIHFCLLDRFQVLGKKQ